MAEPITRFTRETLLAAIETALGGRALNELTEAEFHHYLALFRAAHDSLAILGIQQGLFERGPTSERLSLTSGVIEYKAWPTGMGMFTRTISSPDIHERPNRRARRAAAARRNIYPVTGNA